MPPRKRPRGGGGGAAAGGGEASSSLPSSRKLLQDAIRRACTVAAPPSGEDDEEEEEEEADVDPACWAALKQMLRGGTEEVAAHAFTLLLGQLRDRRVGVRLRALALLDRLVQRSAAVRKQALDHLRVGSRRARSIRQYALFRRTQNPPKGWLHALHRPPSTTITTTTTLLVQPSTQQNATHTHTHTRAQEVLDLTVGGSGRAKLPPPAEEAARLRTRALGCLEEWHAKYAGEHPGVRVAYLHLKEGAGLPAGAAFPDLHAKREDARQRAEAQRAERARSLRARYLAHRAAMRQGAEELRGVLDQMQACFDIVVPDMRLGLEALGEAPVGPAAAGTPAATTTAAATGGEGGDGDENEVEWESGDEGGGQAAKVSWEDLYQDDDFSLGDAAAGGGGNYDDDLFGLGNAPFYELEVELPWLAGNGGGAGGGGGGCCGGGGGGGGDNELETEDVKPVFDELRELYRVLKGRLLPQAELWWRLLACAQGLLQQEQGKKQEQEQEQREQGPGQAVRRPHHHHESAAALLPECRSLLQEMAALRTRALRVVEQCKELRSVVTESRAKQKKKRVAGAAVAPPAATLDLAHFLEEQAEVPLAKKKKG
jgi:hypothetical protein